MAILRLNITMSLDGTSPAPIKASPTRLARAANNCMNGPSPRGLSAQSMAWKAVRLVPTTTSPRNTSRTSGRPSWAATCLAAATVRGETVPGTAGGERIRPSTCPSSSLRITPAIRSKCRAARPSTSSPKASTQPFSGPRTRGGAKTSPWAAAPPWPSNT